MINNYSNIIKFAHGSSMSTGLSEKAFETILQKIKTENHGFVVPDYSSDSEDITENIGGQQNTISEISIPSNKCQNNEEAPNVPETNSQVDTF